MAKKKKVPEGNVISFAPDTFVSGGLFDDDNAVVTSAKFINWERAGYDDVTALELVLKTDDEQEFTQYWSVGSPSVYWPDENGQQIISTKHALNSSSNYAIFLTFLKTAGFPPEKFGSDVKVFEGMYAHWMRVPPPKKRSFKSETAQPDGQKRKDLVLVVNKLLEEPAGKGKKKKQGAKAAPVASTASSGDGDQERACVDAVVATLIAKGGEAPKTDMLREVSNGLPGDWSTDDKNGVIRNMIWQDEWLKGQKEWSFDRGVLKLQ